MAEEENPFDTNVNLEPAVDEEVSLVAEKVEEARLDDPFASHTSVDAVATYNELLAPPSYEDSVTFDSSAKPEEVEKEVEPSTSIDEETPVEVKKSDMEITVSEPLKQPEKDSLIGSTFVTYKIETTTSMEQFKKSEFAVRRRFKEFVALSERLDTSHRGYFIPPRPDKNVVEGKLHNTEFIEVRRVALQKYLQKLANHPVLKNSRELHLFLEWEGDISTCGEWKEMEKQGWKAGLTNLPKQLMGNERSIPSTDEAKSKGDGRNLIRGFKEFRQRMKNKVSKDKPDETETKEEFREEKNSLKELEVLLSEASTQAENVIQRMEKLADSFGDCGLSAIKASKFEEEEGCRNGKYSESGENIRDMALQLKSSGTQCVRMSRLLRSATENTAAQLSHVHDYLGLMPAAFGALKDRDQAILTHQTLTTELQGKRKSVASLEEQSKTKLGGDKNKTRKIHELNQDIEALEKAKEAAQKEYERIEERNVQELERFQKEKKVDFDSMLVGFAKVQAALAERTAKVWKDAGDAMKRKATGEMITTINPAAGL